MAAIFNRSQCTQAEHVPVEASRQEQVTSSYKYGDVNSLVKLHEEIDLDNVREHPEAKTGFGGDYVRAFVLGGLDGAVSTFALVTGLAGASTSIGTLIAVSLAKVLSDGLSMGFGEFMSSSAELDRTLRLKAREVWEMENHLEGEVKEMCEIYMQKGISKEDTLTVMSILSKYKDFFVDHMMVMEHDVIPPEDDDRWAPVKSGLVCFFAFVLFGLVPLIAFIILFAVDPDGAASDEHTVLGIACGLTGFTLFSMGVAKARLTGEGSMLKAGILMLLQGCVAGGASYGVGNRLVAVFERA
jgi:VIT1/CCC1 family predicted Fe2+/Mn2+ transporter